MLSTDEFAAWSDKVVLFLHNTSKVDDEPYPNLLREKGGNGFPTVSFLAEDGRLLKQVGYPITLEEIQSDHDALLAWRDLKKQVAEGDTSKQKELFLLELRNGMIGHDEAVAEKAKLQLTEEEKTTVEQQLTDLEFNEILRGVAREADMAPAGKKFYAMYKAGRIPHTQQDTSFWQFMFAYAGAEKDADKFDELLTAAKKLYANDPRLARYLGQLEKQLEEMRAAK